MLTNRAGSVLARQDMRSSDAGRPTWDARLSWSHTLWAQTLGGLCFLGPQTYCSLGVFACPCPQLVTQNTSASKKSFIRLKRGWGFPFQITKKKTLLLQTAENAFLDDWKRCLFEMTFVLLKLRLMGNYFFNQQQMLFPTVALQMWRTRLQSVKRPSDKWWREKNQTKLNTCDVARSVWSSTRDIWN